MPVVPTYESQVTLRPHDAGTLNPIDTTKMLPSTAPDFSKLSAAAMAFQKKIDASRVLEAKNAAMQYISDATYGENGYLKLQGKAATEADKEGRGLVQRNMESFNEYMDNFIKEGNYTASQKQLLDKELMAVKYQYQNGMGAHVIKQQHVYAAEQVDAAVENANNMALRAGAGDASLEEAVGALDSALALAQQSQGWSDKKTEAQRAKLRSGLYYNAMLSAVYNSSNDPVAGYKRADEIYASHSGEMAATELLNGKRLLSSLERKARKAAVLKATDVMLNGANSPFNRAVISDISNGAKTPKSAMFAAITQVGPDERTYANGGIGIAGVRQEDIISTVKKYNLMPGAKNDEIIARAKADRSFNLQVGAQRLDELVRKYKGDEAQALAAYRVGPSTVDTAITLAKKDGDASKWMDHITKDAADSIKKLIKKSEDIQDGVFKDRDGSIIDPFSAGYMKKMYPQSTDDELRAFVRGIVKKDIDVEELDDLVRAVRAKENTKLTDQERTYQNSVYACIQGIEQGKNLLSIKEFHTLPVAAQKKLTGLQERKAYGDGTPDPVAYATYRLQPGLLAKMSDEHYNTFVRPLMGNKAEHIDLLRNTEILKGEEDEYRRSANINMASQGMRVAAFCPSTKSLNDGIKRVFDMKDSDLKSPLGQGLFVRIRDAALLEAQRRSKYTENGKALPLEGLELENFIQRMKMRDIDGRGTVPFVTPYKSWSDRTAGDTKDINRWLAERYVTNEFKTGATVEKSHEEFVYGSVCAGNSFGAGFPTMAELRAEAQNSGGAVSSAVLDEAIKLVAAAQKCKPEQVSDSVAVLNRYYGLLVMKGGDSLVSRSGDTRMTRVGIDFDA